MQRHPLSPATHTLDMAQIAEISDRLAAPGAPRLTASQLGLDQPDLPPSAVLGRVWWSGAPEFPYVFGSFSLPGGPPGGAPAGAASDLAHIPLHTPHLLKSSHDLGLRHHWGV